jgi:hypothetical protein
MEDLYAANKLRRVFDAMAGAFVAPSFATAIDSSGDETADPAQVHAILTGQATQAFSSPGAPLFPMSLFPFDSPSEMMSSEAAFSAHLRSLPNFPPPWTMPFALSGLVWFIPTPHLLLKPALPLLFVNP